MSNIYRVQVLTKTYVPELGCEYSDCQCFDIAMDMTIEKFVSENEKIIAEEENNRIAQRIYEMNNPPKPIEPTKEELEQQKITLIAQIESIDEKVAEIDAKLVVEMKDKGNK